MSDCPVCGMNCGDTCYRPCEPVNNEGALNRRITELEQRLADRLENWRKEVEGLEQKLAIAESKVHFINRKFEEESEANVKANIKLTERDKLLDDCKGLIVYIRHQYPFAAPVQCDDLLTKLQERDR